MNQHLKAWSWIPSLYFAEGFPYVIVMTVSVIMYKNLGISNADIAFYTSWLYLPWVIKPIWSPIVDLLRTKRWWITTMQLVLGAALAGVALTLPLPDFFRWTLVLFWLMAFASATHDISADGFYMLALDESQQSFFVGIRSIFYRIAMIAGQGGLVWIAGRLCLQEGVTPANAWMWVLGVCGLLFIGIGLYHTFALPKPEQTPAENADDPTYASTLSRLADLFVSFFQKKQIAIALAFTLLYRLGEAQLAKIAMPFLLDSREAGGLAVSTENVGLIYGTIGVLALMTGGILGGILASRFGLKKCLWWMIGAMNLPNLVYVWLAYAQPENLYLVASCIAIEQFGYGFGFTAFMLYLMYIAQGEYQTSHYALCTGFMALGMMIPGMFSGAIQELVGYEYFFIWVCLCTIPGMLLAGLLKIDPSYGKK
ncbi:MAG: AmpG family muropeptide MFS transporter [Paludibacteraceae bacterium]|nr:AmpG family muropeptide MFS transporter [Paludibacteraceae bacterium]